MKELKDYIHLYIGCRVLITDEELVKDLIEAGGDGRGTLTGLHGEYGPEFAANQGHHSAESPEYTWHLKLILRPLESMSDREKREYAAMAHPARYAKNILPSIKAGPLVNHFLNAHDPIIVKWLLGRGFDLYELKEAGLAVYE